MVDFSQWNVLFAGILVAVTVSAGVMIWIGMVRWSRLTQALTDQLNNASTPTTTKQYNVGELDGLPAPVQRYFSAVLQEGQPIITGVTVRHTGTFNASVNGSRWMPFTSEQRVRTKRPGFVWNARMRIAPGIAVLVHDAYVSGVGTLHPSVLGMFSLSRQHGDGEIARGELMRYLAESVWYPTALLPSQGVSWSAINDHSARATLTDGDINLTMLFSFDAAGLVDAVSSEGRGALIDDTLVMMPWECRVSNYQKRDGMLVPLAGEVAWLLPTGRKPYYHGLISAIVYEYAALNAVS